MHYWEPVLDEVLPSLQSKHTHDSTVRTSGVTYCMLEHVYKSHHVHLNEMASAIRPRPSSYDANDLGLHYSGYYPVEMWAVLQSDVRESERGVSCAVLVRIQASPQAQMTVTEEEKQSTCSEQLGIAAGHLHFLHRHRLSANSPSAAALLTDTSTALTKPAGHTHVT